MTIYSVIVCYHPQIAKVRAICESLVADLSRVVVVDNTDVSYLEASTLPPGCEVIALSANTGIAHAQNVGVRHARQNGAAIIAFFDQDSQIEPGFLRILIAQLRVGEAKVVSPLYIDAASGSELPSVRVSRIGLQRAVEQPGAKEPYAVDIVISSGTVATSEVFDVAGLMDEAFFIDFVDTEWCLRCRSRNVPIMVVPGAIMRHTIGAGSLNLGIMTVLVHNPTRCYYQLRNCFLLFRRPHVPFVFAMREAAAVFAGRMLLLLFVTGKSAYFRAYGAAIRDGFAGRTGKKPS